FWRRTENIFFDAVQRLSEQEGYYPLSTEAASVWLKGIQKIVTDLFDEYTLSVDIGDPRTLKRVMKARRFLSIWVYGGRDIKNFKDRKSTRLNSSHVSISYAVFCLKKKNNDVSTSSSLCMLDYSGTAVSAAT